MIRNAIERMGTKALSIAFALAIVHVLAATAPATAFRNVKLGDVAPGFKLAMTSGQEVEYAPPPEVAVVLTFVRQGQEKSEKVLKDLAKLDAAVSEKTQVLAVIINPDDGDAIAWVESIGAKYPVMIDAEGKIYSDYGVVVAPQTAILDKKGVLKEELGGHTASFKRSIEDHLREVLGMEALVDESEAAARELPPERKTAMREVAKAEMLIKRKMKKKAIQQVRKAIESDETYAKAHILLADLLMEDGGDANIAEAEKTLARAAELEPNNQMVKVGQARILAGKGDYDGAVKTLEAAAMISPKPEKLYYYLGNIHQEAGKFEQAALAYRKAIEKMMH